MRVIEQVRAMQAWADKVRREGKRIGLVPTMGCLHEGHLSLIRLARKRTDVVVVSIFVNPTQFGPTEDFEKYPRTFDRDRELVEQAGGEIIFAPGVEEMYPPGFDTSVTVARLTKGLCGASRPGHFRGVTTVVTKLLCAAKPHVAVFGQKDFQQAAVIRRMVRDLNLDVEIVTAPIVREADGLAMSSRNAYLSPKERRDARVLFQSLEKAEKMVRDGEREASEIIAAMKTEIEAKPAARIDYVAVVDAETLEPVTHLKGRALVALAVWIGKTRLIDNVVLEEK
ncbi:MAG: pantoate--beta-alanine ligase [Candidatus Latescibacterota bacterium]|nr:MAG: pantoate--beta-alanine ligase [Candidatus Latescibacterota bacterium]